LHVMDLASGHLLALDALESPTHVAFSNLPDRAKFKAYNLGRGRGQSVYDIVNAMRKATGKDYQTRVIGRRLGDVPDLTADPALAEEELGFHARQDLETMCRDLWNWQTKNPEGYSATERKSVDSTATGWVKVTQAGDPNTPSDFGKPQPTQDPGLLNSTFVVSAPTIPTLKEMFDPRTPAHLSPRHFTKVSDSGVPSPTELDLMDGKNGWKDSAPPEIKVNGST